MGVRKLPAQAASVTTLLYDGMQCINCQTAPIDNSGRAGPSRDSHSSSALVLFDLYRGLKGQARRDTSSWAFPVRGSSRRICRRRSTDSLRYTRVSKAQGRSKQLSLRSAHVHQQRHFQHVNASPSEITDLYAAPKTIAHPALAIERLTRLRNSQNQRNQLARDGADGLGLLASVSRE